MIYFPVFVCILENAPNKKIKKKSTSHKNAPATTKLHQPQQFAAHNNPPPTTDPQANHNNKPINPSFNQIRPQPTKQRTNQQNPPTISGWRSTSTATPRHYNRHDSLRPPRA